jgi:hypothetical protein
MLESASELLPLVALRPGVELERIAAAIELLAFLGRCGKPVRDPVNDSKLIRFAVPVLMAHWIEVTSRPWREAWWRLP